MATAAPPTPAELQALILQLQTQVATLTSGATTAGPAPTAVIFADTPQSLYADDLIDYSTKQGSSIYEQGCKTVDDKALTDGFGMTSDQMVVFVESPGTPKPSTPTSSPLHGLTYVRLVWESYHYYYSSIIFSTHGKSVRFLK
jgi:hypothetical protein